MKHRIADNISGICGIKKVGGVILLCSVILLCGCSKRQDAYSNDRMNNKTDSVQTEEEEECTITEKPTDIIESQEETAGVDIPQNEDSNAQDDGVTSDDSNNTTNIDQPVNSNAVIKENSTYDCDIKADREAYDGHVDITVGDKFYATQINDWYMNFDQYEDKVVEIEGYYIGDFKPYDFVGRYGPSCPYCQGGYVSFEILSDEDLTVYKSAEDWIKVTGILRQGKDAGQGQAFYYIEALKLEKMEKVGKDTVTD